MNTANESEYEKLDQAWAALDEGQPERALELADEADESIAETWVLRAAAALDLDDVALARSAADRAAELSDADEDPELLCIQAELALRDWRVDEAREKLERAQRLAPNAAVLLRLALVADVEGDFGRADRLMREAHKLAPDAVEPPPRLSEGEFDATLNAAIARLDAPFRAALEQVAVIVDPMPSLELVGADRDEAPPDVLGLFTGVSRLEAGEDESADLPPTIHLFQRNLERVCADRAEVEAEIEVTLLHELGHYLGFDEEGVAELGLE